MNFRIRGLPAAHFEHLFALDDAALACLGARRRVADETSRYPCRVSLTDAQPGQPVLLLNYEHHPVATPYRASFAIYVREGEQQFDAINDVPRQLASRLLALRAYDARGMLVDYELCEGTALSVCVQQLFASPAVHYLHAHYAKPGCYAARIDRL